MTQTSKLTSTTCTPTLRRAVGLVLLLFAACQSGPRPEFEPIGSEVGMDGAPRKLLHTPTGIVLLLVEPGDLTMGSPQGEPRRDSDEVQRPMHIAEPFYLGETEVTIAQWQGVMGADPSEWSDDPELPVGGATWYAAQEFVTKLNAGEGGFRLPTEAEWEYACRAGTTTVFPFGDQITTDQANYDGRYPYVGGALGERRRRTIPVRALPPNSWGFYQMPGNVWEWCEDVYRSHPERGLPTSIPAGAPRVLRGGAFTSGGEQLRSAHRDGYPPKSFGSNYGLRVARSLPRPVAPGS